jgi:hypothetical protein
LCSPGALRGPGVAPAVIRPHIQPLSLPALPDRRAGLSRARISPYAESARRGCAMNLRTPLITGTTISLAVTAVWAWLSALTIGPSGPLDVTWRHPAASYLTLVAAPTGNGLGLFTAIACDNPDSGSPFNRSRSAVDTTESAGQVGTRLCRADSGGGALTCATPVTWRPLTRITPHGPPASASWRAASCCQLCEPSLMSPSSGRRPSGPGGC